MPDPPPILQLDGNDTIDDSVGDGLDIAHHNPQHMTTGFTFEDVPSHQSTSTGKTATFALNRDKQVDRLGIDANLADFDVTINNNNENVSIQCSTGFYDTVAKPVICGLLKGSTISMQNISINCQHIDYNRDKTHLCEVMKESSPDCSIMQLG